MQLKKRFLFFLVHPAKFHFHKVQINELKKRGHQVDVLIIHKDILEELVREEGWEYTNIFPEGRKIKGLHVYLAAGISLFRTIYRLWRFTLEKKYDLFIGDALTYVGRLRGVPSLYPTDDVLAAVPEQRTWFYPATYIVAPNITDLGPFDKKTIRYDGYKALAHLHPSYFKPDPQILREDIRDGSTFFLIRCTGFGATHDLNKSGISDEVLIPLVESLLGYGKVLITSERELPESLKKHQLNIKKKDISHYLALAQLFIGDSTTMCTEAAVLGTHSVEFDEYFYEIEQMLELQNKYEMISCFRTHQVEDFLSKVQELAGMTDLKELTKVKRDTLLSEKINVSAWLTWLFENYPESAVEYFNNPDIQYRFK